MHVDLRFLVFFMLLAACSSSDDNAIVLCTSVFVDDILSYNWIDRQQISDSIFSIPTELATSVVTLLTEEEDEVCSP